MFAIDPTPRPRNFASCKAVQKLFGLILAEWIEKNVSLFQRHLEGIGKSRHVMAAGCPPNDLPGFVLAANSLQLLIIFVRQFCRLFGLLSREAEAGTKLRREVGPIAAGKAFHGIFNLSLRKPRDREAHFGMTHSVKAVVCPSHNPKDILSKNPIHLAFLPELIDRIEP